MNDDGITVMNLCDGTNTLQDIIEKISKDNNLEIDKILNGIVKFMIIGFTEYKFLYFVDNALTESKPVKITGSKEFYMPLHFTFEITTRCNLTCKHCYRSAGIEIQEEELSYDEIISIMDQMYDAGARFIELTGGEIFLHPRIKDIINYACEKFIFVGLLTNGVLVTKEVVEYFNKYKEKLKNIKIKIPLPARNQEETGSAA